MAKWKEDHSLVPWEVRFGAEPISMDEAGILAGETAGALGGVGDDAVTAEAVQRIADAPRAPREPAAPLPRQRPARPDYEAALQADNAAQKSEDVRNLLYAAFARKTPQLRNLGTPNQNNVAKREEMALRRLAMQPKGVNPLDDEKKRAEIDALKALVGQRERPPAPKEPRPEKPADYLTPAEQASLEQQLEMAAGMPVKLPRDEQGRTRKDFVGPINSSANMMGMMGQKQAVADEGFDLRRWLDAKDRADKEAKQKADEEKAQSGMEIPGWGRPSVRVSEADASKMRAAKGEAEAFDVAAGKLIAAIKQHGTVINPKHAAYGTIGALMTDIIAKAKGAAAYDLGVLAGPDMDLIRGSTGEPQTLRGMFKGPEDAISRLTVLRDSVKGKLSAKGKAFGYPVGGAPSGEAKKRYRKNESGQWEEVD